jgi:hypothetical protein
MTDSTRSLLSTFDHVWSRLLARLDGLSDEEYLWEPVQGAWSLRLGPSGRWLLDGGGGGGPAPEPAPVTTIAWRLGHLGGLALGGFTNWRFGDGTLRPESLDFPSTAQEARGFLDGHYRTWRDSLAGLEDSGPHRTGAHRPGAGTRGRIPLTTDRSVVGWKTVE